METGETVSQIRLEALREECEGYVELEMYDQALNVVQQLMDLGRLMPYAMLALARIQLATGNCEDAVQTVDDLTARADDVEVSPALAIRTQALMLLGRKEDALSTADACLDAAEDEGELLHAALLKTQALLQIGRNEEALALALADAPSITRCQSGRFLLAVIHFAMGNYESALREVTSLLEEGSDLTGVRELRGESLMHLERYEEAIRMFRKVKTEYPERPVAYLGLGFCYKRTGRMDQAVQVLRELRDRSPDNPIAHFNLACYLSLNGEREASLESLDMAIRMDESLVASAGTDPDLDAVRDDPLFQAIVEGRD